MRWGGRSWEVRVGKKDGWKDGVGAWWGYGVAVEAGLRVRLQVRMRMGVGGFGWVSYG